MSEFEQSLLLMTSGLIILGTLVVVLWQWWRGRGRGGDRD